MTHQFCIVGPGAIGITMAITMSQNRAVTLLCKEKHLADIRDRPLKLQRAGNSISTEKFQLCTAKKLPQTFAHTHVLICVKAYDLEDVLVELREPLSQARSVSIASNGLSIYLQAASILTKRTPLIRLLPSFGVQRGEPNVVQLSGNLKLAIAAPLTFRSLSEELSQVLEEAGFEVSHPKDVATAEWQKALINIVVNTICSVYNRPNGALLDDPSLHRLAEEVLLEVVHVAKAEGFDLKFFLDPNSPKYFFHALRNYASNINSTLADLRAGRQTESQFIAGRFLRIAQDLGIECPQTSTLYSKLLSLEKQSLEHSKLNFW